MEIQRLDLRKLEPAARAQLRRTGLRVFKRGPWQSALGREWGRRRSSVAQWVGTSNSGPGLQEGRRGRPLGHGRRLTPAQEARLQQDLVEQTPAPLKRRFALGNAPAVRALIKAHVGIHRPVRTGRWYLKRWGFPPQRPWQRTFEQKPAAVRKWLDTD